MNKFLYASAITALLASGCGSMNVPEHTPDAQVFYHNAQYNFTLALSASWRGYLVMVEQWDGQTFLAAADKVVTEHGPLIVLRHPQWKADDPYQDIPIMVFTRSQWEASHEGRFSIGAGGVIYEMCHSRKYVLGMHSRFNADDSLKGWKEAADIVERFMAANDTPHLYPD